MVYFDRRSVAQTGWNPLTHYWPFILSSVVFVPLVIVILLGVLTARARGGTADMESMARSARKSFGAVALWNLTLMLPTFLVIAVSALFAYAGSGPPAIVRLISTIGLWVWVPITLLLFPVPYVAASEGTNFKESFRASITLYGRFPRKSLSFIVLAIGALTALDVARQVVDRVHWRFVSTSEGVRRVPLDWTAFWGSHLLGVTILLSSVVVVCSFIQILNDTRIGWADSRGAVPERGPA